MKEIERTCCVCRKKYNKQEMIRISYFGNELFVDNLKQKNGKGCYVCKEQECLNKLIIKKVPNHFYKCNISQENYDKLSKELEFAKSNNSKNQ